MASETIAERLFNAMDLEKSIENDADDALLRAAGIDLDKPDEWPFEDITYDPYDASFEFKGVLRGWGPSRKTRKAWAELGFMRCWICYKDVGAQELYFTLRKGA